LRTSRVNTVISLERLIWDDNQNYDGATWWDNKARRRI